MTWALDYFPADVALEDTMKLAATIIRENGEGVQSYLELRRLRLPSRDEQKYKLWHSGGSTPPLPIPVSVLAMQQPDEKRLVKTMIEEIRTMLAVDLDPNPTFERGLGGQRPKQARDFLLIGSSNASKLSVALSQKGYSSCCIFNQNFRIDAASVEDIRPRVKEAIRDKDPSVIVFHCLDNSVFYSRSSDSSRTAPKRGPDGLFHVEGEVAVCSRDILNEHLRPLLELVGKKRGIVIAPLPRYIVTGCCSNPEHCSNRRLLDFEQQQLQSLDIIKRSIKDFLFCHGLRFIRVLDPLVDIRGMEASEVWGTDPIHPQPAVYNKMAAATAKLGDKIKMAEAEAKRRRDSMGDQGQSRPNARCGRGGPPSDDSRGQSWRGGGRGSQGGQGDGWGGYRDQPRGQQRRYQPQY
jgi:hypothetical protein